MLPSAPLFAAVTLSALLALASDDERMEDLDFLVATIERVHPDPFAFQTREEWRAEVDAVRARLATLSDEEFFLALRGLVARVEDGHTELVPSFASPMAMSWPIDFESLDDGVFIAGAGKDAAPLAGARVLKIAGVPIDDVRAAFGPYLCSDNEAAKDEQFAMLLTFPELLRALRIGAGDGPARMTMTIEQDGKERDVEIAPPSPGPPWFAGPRPRGWTTAGPSGERAPLRDRDRDRPYWFALEDDGALAYLRFSQIANDPNEPIDVFCRRVLAALVEHPNAKLVIDLRGNNGGNNHLTQPLVHMVIRAPQDRAGGTFVIIDAHTFSAAMNCATRLERETWALFVGAPTGGRPNHFGDAQEFPLPHSGHVLHCSTLRWQDSDPSDRRRAIFPDLPAPLDGDALRTGSDPALDRIRAWQPATIAGFTSTLPLEHWRRATQRVAK